MQYRISSIAAIYDKSLRLNSTSATEQLMPVSSSASNKKSIIDSMIRNGMDIARINTKWAKPEETIKLILRLNQKVMKLDTGIVFLNLLIN